MEKLNEAVYLITMNAICTSEKIAQVLALPLIIR